MINEQTNKHPCYSLEASHQYARMHLPVAPACNISCNYCSRKFDCVNESRPGVTSKILTPEEAHVRYQSAKERLPYLAVVGIAGPGDALANWDQTRKTIELIRQDDKDIVLCLSTNGLMLPQYADELDGLGVKHITVTVNCLEPEIGSKIYKHVNYGGKRFVGIEGAQILIENQLEGIRCLIKNKAIVKVNMVMVEGINEKHIAHVAKEVGSMGVYIGNIMPMTPAPGSVFQNFKPTNSCKVHQMREQCKNYLLQMSHCKQCRADAVGLLGEDFSRDCTSEKDSVAKAERRCECHEKAC